MTGIWQDCPKGRCELLEPCEKLALVRLTQPEMAVLGVIQDCPGLSVC